MQKRLKGVSGLPNATYCQNKRNYLREREDSGASEPHFCYAEIRQASEPTS